MNRIKARLQQTSQSWIATIVLVLNLVKLAGRVPVSLIADLITYSANMFFALLSKTSQVQLQRVMTNV